MSNDERDVTTRYQKLIKLFVKAIQMYNNYGHLRNGSFHEYRREWLTVNKQVVCTKFE